MDQSHTTVMMALAFAGLGLLVAGLVTLACHRLSFLWRAALSTLAAGAATGGAVAWDGVEFAAITAMALAVVKVPYLLIASPAFGSLLAWFANRPALAAAPLCAVGLATVLGGFVWFDKQDERQIDENMSILASLEAQPPLTVPTDVQVRTDLGNPVVVKSPVEARSADAITTTERRLMSTQGWEASVIRTSSPSDTSNCHGWVFTGGRYWVEGAKVEHILQENGYVPVKSPQPGDIVVYRGEPGVTHTAVVRYVSEGQPALVEGKWGSMGVYLHRVNESVYGQDFTFYHSPRKGHLLAGLDPSTEHSAGSVGAPVPNP